MSNSSRVLVTGALGVIGQPTVRHLVEDGAEVVALDIRTPANVKAEARLHRDVGLATAWVDISDADEVERVVGEVEPTHIVHLASIIPPHVYTSGDRAQSVNIDGTRHLIEAAQRLGSAPHFVFASSHTVHGCRNGARELPPLAADTPRQPSDVYTAGKIACEDLLRASDLPWTILRFGINFPLSYGRRLDPLTLRLSYLVPLESRTHGLHGDDAGLAFARAIRAEAVGKVLMIGGDERWQQTQGDFVRRILSVAGVGMLPEAAYFQPHPDKDASWYYNDWLDTAESQAVLDYQRHSPEQYFAQLARSMRWVRPVTRLVAPLVRRRMVGLSPFYRDEVARHATDSTLAERIERYVLPATG